MLVCALVNDALLLYITPKLSNVKQQQLDLVHNFVSWESAKGFAGQFSFGAFHTVVVRCQLCCSHLRAQLGCISPMAHTVAAT